MAVCAFRKLQSAILNCSIVSGDFCFDRLSCHYLTRSHLSLVQHANKVIIIIIIISKSPKTTAKTECSVDRLRHVETAKT